MALTMVQQCKAWFEAGLDDKIIDLVCDFAKSHNFSLDSQATINLPASKERDEHIHALFWLGAANNRHGIKYHDIPRVKAGIELLLPLYSEYCDDLNYYVSLALAFEYLGEYEQSLSYLYEAIGQFPTIARVDDMIEEVAAKLSINQCDFSFNRKARNAWQELLKNVPAINSYLAIINPSSDEQQLLKDLITKPFSKVCGFFDVQVQTRTKDVYFYLSCHGDESLFIALEHCLALKRDGFPSHWHFSAGLQPMGEVCLEIDGIDFDTKQTWCSLQVSNNSMELTNSKLTSSALSLLKSKFSHSSESSKFEPCLIDINKRQANSPSNNDVLSKTNLANNLGQKKERPISKDSKSYVNTKAQSASSPAQSLQETKDSSSYQDRSAHIKCMTETIEHGNCDLGVTSHGTAEHGSYEQKQANFAAVEAGDGYFTAGDMSNQSFNQADGQTWYPQAASSYTSQGTDISKSAAVNQPDSNIQGLKQGTNSNQSQNSFNEQNTNSAELDDGAIEPSLDLSSLDPDLFPDLFEDDINEVESDIKVSLDEKLELTTAPSPCNNYVLQLYHPMLYTWFKASKSQHHLVLDRMMKTLSCYALGELNTIGLCAQVQMIKSKAPLSFKLSKLSTVLDAMDINLTFGYYDYLANSYLIDYTKGKSSVQSVDKGSIASQAKSSLSAGGNLSLLDKLALPLRKDLIFSVHNNAQLYHELYHESCDQTAINLLCAQCVPCYFALKRTQLTKGSLINQDSQAWQSTATKQARIHEHSNGKSNGSTVKPNSPSSTEAAQAQATIKAQAQAQNEAYSHDQTQVFNQAKAQDFLKEQGQASSFGQSQEGIFASFSGQTPSPSSEAKIDDSNLSDAAMIRLSEMFIEGFTNFVITQGYQYSMHLMGYALNKDYVFIDVMAFDFKLCLHALSSYLTENYPDIVSLQAGLMVKGSTLSTIDFITER